jgi:hypothetical protein
MKPLIWPPSGGSSGGLRGASGVFCPTATDPGGDAAGLAHGTSGHRRRGRPHPDPLRTRDERAARRASRRLPPTHDADFERRLGAEFDRLHRLFAELYGERDDALDALAGVVGDAEASWATRPDDLRALDASREHDADWYGSNRMLGGVCYVDRYGRPRRSASANPRVRRARPHLPAPHAVGVRRGRQRTDQRPPGLTRSRTRARRMPRGVAACHAEPAVAAVLTPELSRRARASRTRRRRRRRTHPDDRTRPVLPRTGPLHGAPAPRPRWPPVRSGRIPPRRPARRRRTGADWSRARGSGAAWDRRGCPAGASTSRRTLVDPWVGDYRASARGERRSFGGHPTCGGHRDRVSGRTDPCSSVGACPCSRTRSAGWSPPRG